MRDAHPGSEGPHRRALLRRAALCASLGLPGVLSALLIAPPLPEGAPAAALLINLTVLLVLAGAALAPPIGLRSRILPGSDERRIRRGDAFAICLAVILGGAIALGDAASGAGHLPALMLSGVELGAAFLLPTLGLNLVFGLVFFRAFVQRNLETAMLLHAGSPLGFPLAAASGWRAS